MPIRYKPSVRWGISRVPKPAQQTARFWDENERIINRREKNRGDKRDVQNIIELPVLRIDSEAALVRRERMLVEVTIDHDE